MTSHHTEFRLHFQIPYQKTTRGWGWGDLLGAMAIYLPDFCNKPQQPSVRSIQGNFFFFFFPEPFSISCSGQRNGVGPLSKSIRRRRIIK